MLEGTRALTLSYNSVIDGKPVVFLSAQIPANGRCSMSKNIQDKDLYEAHKDECRADMAAFEKMLYNLEDLETVPVHDVN